LSEMSKILRTRAFPILGLVVLLVSLSSEQSAAQTSSPYYYYYEGGRIPLTLNPSRIFVRFKPGVSESTQRALSDATGDVQDFSARLQEQPLSASMLRVAQGHDPLSAIRKLKQRPEVQSAGPVFQFEDGGQYAETDEFIARFRADLSPAAIATFNLSSGVELVREQEYSIHVLILRPLPGNQNSALDLANAYVRSGLVEFAEPNFVIIQPRLPVSTATAAPKSPVTPNDPDFPYQWSLKNTGILQGSVPGADINAPAAWGVTTGATQIKIAVIDEGVDSTNVDLSAKVLQGINVTRNPNDTNTLPNVGDFHGTAVAGIAAAKTDNNEEIAGVCWMCKILPVKVAYEDPNHNWVTTPSELAAGIDWAWSNGADVLSNSWTMSAPSEDVKISITNAIANARFGGRGGLGSTVVFSAGNSNSDTIPFPARLNNYVIAVGASNWCDKRKTPTNNVCNDGEYWWGSNYGAALDLLAPGQAILTTCNGASCSDYFSGTSASAPMVAGVVGLLYSLNPNLQPQDVQNALQQGAIDLPPAGRDDQSGYGRVDAYRAIAALYDVSIGISDNNPLARVGDSVQYTLKYSNSGMTAMGGTLVMVTLPPGLTYAGSNPAFTSLGGGVYQLNVGNLARFASNTATLTAQVQPGSEGEELTTNAQITGSFPELNTGNNSATDAIAVVARYLFLPLITH
jgi:thermitase